MKAFLSAAEIAAEKLPGLPNVERAIKRNADRLGWTSRPRSGRGGGLEYAIDSLPATARAAYVARHIDAVEIPASVARDAAAEPDAVDIKGNAASARDARLAVLALADRIAQDAGIGHKRADQHFADLYNTRAIELAGWITDEIKSVTPRTLARWRSFAKAGKRSRLAVDRAASRRGTGVLDRANDGKVKLHILALVAKQPQLTAHHIRALVADAFPEICVAGAPVALPPIRTFQQVLKNWRTSYRVEIESIRNPDGFKNRMRFAARVANPAKRLNEVWQIDASPADVLTTDGRYTIYVCEDIYSRRLVATVTKTPRAAAVGLLIRKAILAWGVPERIKTDNGSDFIARTTQRLFAALSIEHEKSAPFSPEQKGHVERAIGTMQRGLMRTLEGFIGHSVADRKVIENRKAFSARLGEAPEDMFQVNLSAAELQARVDDWCNDVYGRAPHSGLKGQTPFAVAAMAAGNLRRIEDVRALDMLLAPVAGKDGVRTVTKTGIRIDGAHYIGGFLNVGDQVMVRMDEEDMGRAYVYEVDGETYLGEVVAPELAGIDPAKAIAAARAEQKRLIAERMDDVKKQARKIRAKDFADSIRRQSLRDEGKLIEFPKPEVPHDTPALAAAREAFAPHDIARHAAGVAELAAQLRAETESSGAASVNPLRPTETPHQRWNRARAIEASVARKEFVEPDELLWLGEYRQGYEYRGFLATYGGELASTTGEEIHAG
ncbi:Mu transposase C-terminal domain-containing protein [Bradyrhizobium quebecense]|uniref:Transposase n=1 Tax=Bradyrhizobium quebecense TaxID=2748629 RepID=A0A974AEF8_9BRAD|nr:Mu transposase C-terminal domain-containing protein [Bradyrhizobium quebecense]UGA45979.1 Mu transposase C-terminal domain-containing protein [Bradyrhizobium quebecense]